MMQQRAPRLGNTFQQIAEAQRAWARRNGIRFTRDCRVSNMEENLFEPLRAQTLEEFRNADGRELEDKFLALYSSAALAANFFDHWRDQPKVIGAALSAPDSRALCFERKHILFDGVVPSYHSGGAVKCPNVDVELAGPACTLVFECKFTEPFVHYPNRHAPFTSTYFCADAMPLWNGLEATRSVALRIQRGQDSFESLGAAQLIKTALACHRAFGSKGWRFIYLWYELQIDAACESESRAHREELDRFVRETSGEIPLEALTWEELFRRVETQPDAHGDKWLAWMGERYFRLEQA